MIQKTIEAVSRVSAAVPDTEERVARRVEIGHCAAHQGDVYLFLVSADWPRGEAWGGGGVVANQIAVGGTVGARHVVSGDGIACFKGVKLPDAVKPWRDVPESEYLGPLVVAPNGLRLCHPEHTDHVLPAGVYQTTYQVDVVRRARVID